MVFLLWLGLSLVSLLSAQSVTSVSGVVSDPTGAVIPGATISLENTATGAKRETTSDAAGRYLVPQLPPGNYKLVARSSGFADVVISELRLLVNSPATVPIVFTKVGSVTESVSVSGETTGINTVDASLGNAFGSRPILQLPLEGRNVVGLLSLQPGVTFLGENQTSSRNGAVNGGKSDQANVTLDGIDVNDQQDRSAFTSVLRVTLDSVQEFRVTTTNANADLGRSSGAQIALVTKSGTNELHGSLYEFHRNTATTANSFFNNAATPAVARPKLIRNTFGASAGGPLRKNRLFLFGNYEGRRDARESTVNRTVPTETFRQGILRYVRRDNSIGQLSPADIRRLDPRGLGVNAEVLKLFQSYPLPNNTNVGDGLNTAGFLFVAPTPVRWNTYIARLDFNPSDSGRHHVFVRGNLQNDRDVGTPQFPGDPPNRVNLNNSKGLAVGYTAILKPTLTGVFRYGFTRQGVESSGTQTRPAVGFLGLDDRFGLTTSAIRILPVTNTAQDFTWIRSAHSLQFGAVQRFIRNNRNNYNNSFHSAQVRASRLRDGGASLEVPDLNPRNSDAYRTNIINLLGVISTGSANYNYDLQGNVQPVGTPVARRFRTDEWEFYFQDTWRMSRALTLTAGLRYSLMTPIEEANGMIVSPTPALGAWFDERGGLAQQGRPQSAVTPIRYVPVRSPGGLPLYAFHKKNLAPRFALAYAPQARSGLARFLFGEPGSTAIRAGWGMFYDLIGNSLILRSDAGSFGLQTSIQSAGSLFTTETGPRFTGVFDLPEVLIPPPPRMSFPVEAPFTFARGSNIDSQIRPPYTMNMTFSIGREFKSGLFVQGSYVSRLSRRSLAQADTATPVNLVDPVSGMTYYQAATQLALLAKAGVPVNQAPRIPFWENLWNSAPNSTLTPTQTAYQKFLQRRVDYSTALEDLDRFCDPACSKLGPNALYDRQFASLTTWRSIAGGSYHAMQWTIRQRFRAGVEFGFNYTWSRSIDLSSRAESDGTGPTFGFITQPWEPRQHKAVSDYDMTHQWNANWVAELPFGRGKRFGNRGGWTNLWIGGWQLSGIYRHSSGLPISVSNGRNWPTNWQWQGYATPLGPVPGVKTTKNAPAVTGLGGPNLFRDPNAALAAFDFTLPGQIGNRNGLRGDGYFTIDLGVNKRFQMPYSEKHSLQIRWETFNFTNSVRFDVASASLSLSNQGTFGRYGGVLTQPRVMQFGARYEF
ncbi:MAG: carboxypeptidase-like regulatory domain-containing protein [Bryobacteraceae bacterium]|nr:carboxypeptidase-like regulatory domain-containing protein [Bryobacteraceae bacterium]MDW8380092.1 carboxypeptidase-like regulatory domain-containing protein [Bryobacterales bacterium]